MIKLKKLIKESGMKINEGTDYIVTIEDRKGKLIQRGSFTFKDDAKI